MIENSGPKKTLMMCLTLAQLRGVEQTIKALENSCILGFYTFDRYC